MQITYGNSPIVAILVNGKYNDIYRIEEDSKRFFGRVEWHFSHCPLSELQEDNTTLCRYTNEYCNPTDKSLCWLQIIIQDTENRINRFAGYPTYQEYLNSEHWQKKRKEALEHYANHCNLCGSTEALNVHHNNYDRLGNEEMTDLTVLCRDCHAKFHDKAVR